MRLTPGLRRILLSTLALLYASGLMTWMLSKWFLLDGGFGLESSPLRVWWLEIHSIAGLFFLVVFGYLLHSHVRPGWRRRKRRKSGGTLTASILFLIITVPFLFYVSNETLKTQVVWIHTYFGIAAVLPFFVHYFLVTRD
jgi:hypothetical protein